MDGTMNDQADSLFAFDWAETRGLDCHLVEWEARAGRGGFSPVVLEMSQALYSAFSELRKIRRIMDEGKPGVEHSAYQFRFELFAHNHFLSVATTRVLKILRIGYPGIADQIKARHTQLIDRIGKYRDSLEHQTEIGLGRKAPKFFNNLDDSGYTSEGNAVAYADVERLLNDVMLQVESAVSP
jgi:hypothetical protein